MGTKTMPPNKWDKKILDLLAGTGRPYTFSELMEELKIHPGPLAYCLNKMISKGLIECIYLGPDNVLRKKRYYRIAKVAVEERAREKVKMWVARDRGDPPLASCAPKEGLLLFGNDHDLQDAIDGFTSPEEVVRSMMYNRWWAIVEHFRNKSPGGKA